MAKPYILHLPRWYPTPNQPDMAPFVRAHARASSHSTKAVVVFAFAGEKDEVYHLTEEGLTEILIEFKSKGNRLKNAIHHWTLWKKSIQETLSSLGKPSIIHAHVHTRPVLMARQLGKKLGIPYVVTEHWSGYGNGNFKKLHPLKQSIIKSAFQGAAHILPVSEVLMNGMIASGIKGKLSVVPNVVEIPKSKIFPNKSQIHSGREPFRFLVMADMRDSIKNISGILRAFNALNHQTAELVLIGDGVDKPELQKSASGNPRVIFKPACAHEKVFDHLASADVLIINSHFETFSVVCLESIGMGTPVISTRCGGPETWITPKTGILINPDSETELVGAMEKMLSNPFRVSQKEAKNLLTPFSEQAIGRQLHQIYAPWLS